MAKSSFDNFLPPGIDEPITKSQKGAPHVDQSKVETLISFGFEEEVARKALQASVKNYLTGIEVLNLY